MLQERKTWGRGGYMPCYTAADFEEMYVRVVIATEAIEAELHTPEGSLMLTLWGGEARRLRDRLDEALERLEELEEMGK